MIILSPTGTPVTTFEDWAAVFDVPKKQKHWKEHRSAYSLADFVFHRDGLEKIRGRASQLVGSDIQFERAIIEQELRFDSYGHGREHDLGIYGRTEEGQTVFIGLEAKVDEPFGDTVQEAYLKAKVKELSGESTNAPQRIEDLLRLNFSTLSRDVFNLRYQLLYATAGTLAANADHSILYTAVFNTPLYDEVKGADNFRDYLAFMNRLHADRAGTKVDAADIRQVTIGDKLLHCVYENIDTAAYL